MPASEVTSDAASVLQHEFSSVCYLIQFCDGTEEGILALFGGRKSRQSGRFSDLKGHLLNLINSFTKCSFVLLSEHLSDSQASDCCPDLN